MRNLEFVERNLLSTTRLCFLVCHDMQKHLIVVNGQDGTKLIISELGYQKNMCYMDIEIQ